MERVEPDQTASFDRAAHSQGIVDKDGRNQNLQGRRWIYSSSAGEGKTEELPVWNEPNLYQDQGVDHGQQQSFCIRARITEIRRKLHEWYEGRVSRLAGWFESLRHKRSGEQQRAIEASRSSYDSYRAKFGECLSSLNASLRGLSDTNRAIEQAREQNHSRDYGMER